MNVESANGHRCARCQGVAREGYLFTCAECGRQLGECADCGWCVRLFDTDNPADCDGCGYAPLSPEEEERRRPEGERLGAAIARQFDAMSQMTQRSGPVYETARQRSRIVREAYRAAGSPCHVIAVHTPAGLRFMRYVAPPKVASEPATDEEWQAWQAWCRERERLRREVGSKRAHGM